LGAGSPPTSREAAHNAEQLCVHFTLLAKMDSGCFGRLVGGAIRGNFNHTIDTSFVTIIDGKYFVIFPPPTRPPDFQPVS
jgi:hypothetical protein